MKKTGLVCLIILLLSGCVGQLDEDNIIYHSYIEEMKELKKVTTSKDVVNVSIELDRHTDDEITYSVVIDNPKESMKNIEAIVYHDQKTADVFPSVGIYDQKLNLIPEQKHDEKNVKGIVLVGYIATTKPIEQFHPTIQVMIVYSNPENERKKIYYSQTL